MQIMRSHFFQAMSILHSAFNIVQTFLHNLKLVLNSDKTKSVLFSENPSFLHRLATHTHNGAEVIQFSQIVVLLSSLMWKHWHRI